MFRPIITLAGRFSLKLPTLCFLQPPLVVEMKADCPSSKQDFVCLITCYFCLRSKVLGHFGLLVFIHYIPRRIS